jgi:hypothetical protein
MRYWQLDANTFGTSDDDVDLSLLDPRAVELTEAVWAADTAALNESATPRVPTPPRVTTLRGNGLTHATDGSASRVTISIIAPVGGNVQGRPHLNGDPIAATPGGPPFVFVAPGVMVVETKAGSNDIVIVEEF